MKTYRIIILFFILSFTGALRAQESPVFPVHFRVNSTVIDSAYMGNSKCLKSIAEYIKKVTSTPNITIKPISLLVVPPLPKVAMSSTVVSPRSGPMPSGVSCALFIPFLTASSLSMTIISNGTA